MDGFKKIQSTGLTAKQIRHICNVAISSQLKSICLDLYVAT